VHVERYGSGPEAYFALHGWSGDHRTFEPLAHYLPASASLYSADLPGYGKSPAPGSWELPVITKEIGAALNLIDAAQVTLIGNCSGANLSLFAARQLATRIRRFVLIDPFAYMPWYFKIFLAKSFGRYAYLTTFANPVGRRLTNLSLKGHRTAKTDLTHSFARVNHEVTYNYLALLGEIENIAQFNGLSMPIDIAYGRRTFGAVKKSVSLWQNIWPHARAWQLESAGHLPIEEATAQLSEIIFTETAEKQR
jgi:pimeloyl-ACP methyl ester carboxylesterase